MQVGLAPEKFKPVGLNVRLGEPLVLEGGDILRDLRVRLTTYGHLNTDRSNVVWVFHALTGSSEATEWWSGLVGEGRALSPKRDFIVCANMLGSCYGTTGPEDLNFPVFTIRDQVEVFRRVAWEIGVDKIRLGIGGSMGGQHLLEWAVQEPDRFDTIVPIATNAVHSPWGIAFNEAQRMALENPDIEKGLEAARAIGMLSYRTYETYEKTQRDEDGRVDGFSAGSYQRYQGEKLRKRFSPHSYWYLSKAMDSHNVGRWHGGIENALQRIHSKAIVIGIESDILFPVHEQELIANHLQNSSFHKVQSLYGHDGFLVETQQIENSLRQQLK
jgi:homoserine O-acetyltransferase/O-succinyltransferase